MAFREKNVLVTQKYFHLSLAVSMVWKHSLASPSKVIISIKKAEKGD